jgi:hypothetical protein
MGFSSRAWGGARAARAADQGPRNTGGEVPGPTALEGPELPVERDGCSLGLVVSPTQGLSVHDGGLTTPAMRMNVVRLESLSASAASSDPSMVFAATPSPRQDDRLVRPGEPAHRVTVTARMGERMSHPNHRQEQDEHQPGGDPGRRGRSQPERVQRGVQDRGHRTRRCRRRRSTEHINEDRHSPPPNEGVPSLGPATHGRRLAAHLRPGGHATRQMSAPGKHRRRGRGAPVASPLFSR